MMKRDLLFATTVFSLAISPTALAVGVAARLMSRIDGGAGISTSESIWVTLGFVGAASSGLVAALMILPTARATTFAARRWLFPLACGVVFSIAAIVGVVENSTDVVGRFIGHQHETWLLVAAVAAWAAIATAGVAVLEAVLRLLGRRLVQNA